MARSVSPPPHSSRFDQSTSSTSSRPLPPPITTNTASSSTRESSTFAGELATASTSRATSTTSSVSPRHASKSAITMQSDLESEVEQSEGGQEEGVYKILSKQDIEGIEDTFLVQLVEGGKRVRRTRTELTESAPILLSQFDKAESKRNSRSASATASGSNSRSTRTSRQPTDDGDLEMARSYDSKRRSNRNTSRTSYTEEDEDEDEEGEEEEEAEASSSEDEDDEEFGVTKKKSSKKNKRKQKGEKVSREGTRHSSRDKGKKKVNYDLGEEEEDEDDEMEIELNDETEESEEENAQASGEEEEEQSGDELNIPGSKGQEKEVIEISSDGEVEQKEQVNGEGEEEEMKEISIDESRPQDMHYPLCANPKCAKKPVPILQAKYNEKKQQRKRKGGRKKNDPDAYGTDEEMSMDEAKGAWIECDTCIMAYHFGCLSSPVQKKIKAKLDSEHSKSDSKSKKRTKVELDTNKVLKVKRCTSCEKTSGHVCFGCERSGKKVTDFEKSHHESVKKEEEDVKMKDGDSTSDEIVPGLMFRCQTCKRAAHYGCLDPTRLTNSETDFVNHTQTYFNYGICHDCHHYDNQLRVEVDVILGWRELEGKKPPQGEKMKDKKSGKEFVSPNAKEPTFPAEYLVKWKDLSYRDVAWVKHSWLSARYQLKLSNFLTKGSTISFEPSKEELGEEAEELEPDAKEAAAAQAQEEDYPLGPVPDADIESRIPQAWKTVDRVLKVTFTSPLSGRAIGIKDFKTRDTNDAVSVKHVKTAYMKWCGLPYSQATEQEPPKEGDPGYESFFKAYKAYIVASDLKMRVPKLTPNEMKILDAKRKGKSPFLVAQPDTIKNGQLMDFQLDGLNFLINHWWVKTGCILADEMGLGKTCQLICFISYLSDKMKARPFLIVVPNSLVSNWLREFEKWAPELRTVAYNGDGASRSIVENFEMFAENGDLKTHVVITTYEAFKGHTNVFTRCARWDCVVIDEGQALKSGEGNKLWASLERLKIGMKVLLTGTPLNNNLKELYNLLNFLDPERFSDVEALADPTQEMNKERVDKIRADLQPYMLRRTKDQVLNLPPLGEFVVPVHLTLLQRQLYRGILEKNSAAILSIVNNAGKTKSKAKTTATTNTLMTLRKIVCHPYLHVPELDPGKSVTPPEAYRQLTDASAKLLLLEQMLPKLRQKGHKVLIFSQFKIVLNKLGPFLDGLGAKWLRLDGDTPQLERQRDVDRFNDPNSPYSVFILSTRAGGVGLTLTAADVVIIFDQDFNPFQDMQAIARAHRIGQKNPVRVFRLVVKGTCEEKILASGRKKQGLEHLIIQKIDAKDDETEDVASALQYGAQAILETDDAEAEKAAQRYTEAEIDELLSKTAEPLTEAAKENAGAFSTAQVWVSEKGGLGDVSQMGQQVEAEEDLGGFWDRIVAKEAQKEQEKKELEEFETGGRSRRAKKNVNYVVPTALVPMTDAEKAKRRAARGASGGNTTSGDEFRYRSENNGSDSDEFIPGEDLNIEARQLLAGERNNQARPAVPAPAPRPSGSEPSRSRPSKNEEEEAALVRLQKKKLEQRKQAILPLIEAAKEINDREVLHTLNKAMMCTNAVEQKTLLTEATRFLNEKAANLLPTPNKKDKRPAPPSAQSAPAPRPQQQPRPVDSSASRDSGAVKRKSDSPAELAAKRPKTSSEAKPSTSNEKPHSSGSKNGGGASSMIRADSKGSGSEGGKKSAFSQSKLSFAARPTSASSSSAAPGPSHPVAAANGSGSAPRPSAPAPPSSSSSAPKDIGKPVKKSETIVISDSEED